MKLHWKVISLIISLGALILFSWLSTVNAFFAKWIWIFAVIFGLVALSFIATIITDIVDSFRGNKK